MAALYSFADFRVEQPRDKRGKGKKLDFLEMLKVFMKCFNVGCRFCVDGQLVQHGQPYRALFNKEYDLDLRRRIVVWLEGVCPNSLPFPVMKMIAVVDENALTWFSPLITESGVIHLDFHWKTPRNFMCKLMPLHASPK